MLSVGTVMSGCLFRSGSGLMSSGTALWSPTVLQQCIRREWSIFWNIHTKTLAVFDTMFSDGINDSYFFFLTSVCQRPCGNSHHRKKVSPQKGKKLSIKTIINCFFSP
jgi:hypothetical protein